MCVIRVILPAVATSCNLETSVIKALIVLWWSPLEIGSGLTPAHCIVRFSFSSSSLPGKGTVHATSTGELMINFPGSAGYDPRRKLATASLCLARTCCGHIREKPARGLLSHFLGSGRSRVNSRIASTCNCFLVTLKKTRLVF